MIVSKIAAVVVVYNKNVSESITCDRLLKLNRNEVTSKRIRAGGAY